MPNMEDRGVKVSGSAERIVLSMVVSVVLGSALSVAILVGLPLGMAVGTVVAIAVNVQDSAITTSQMESALRASPVTGLRADYIMKKGEITVIKVGQ